jgi:hypothetical protein
MVGFLSSCGSHKGVAEFELFRNGYVATYETGDMILDRLAVAEREAFELTDMLNKEKEKTPDLVVFDPKNAAYYSKAVDPPGTAAFRRSLKAVQTYNDALYGLASGQTAEVIAARFSQLGAIGTSATLEASIILGAPQMASGVTAVNTAIELLKPLGELALDFTTREEFREELLENAHKMQDILDATKKSTPQIFDMLFAKMIYNSYENNRGLLKEEDVEKVKTTRELMANWVILLEASQLALKETVAAIKKDSGQASLTGIILTASELEAVAREVRQNLAKTGN